MGKQLTQEEFLQKLKDNNIQSIPLEEYKGSHIKIKWQCSRNEQHIFDSSPSDIYRSTYHCPYCAHQKVLVGLTDMWTTNPELASMLYDKNDGYKYFQASNQRVDWICPNCGNILKDKIIGNVYRYGLSCIYCSDGFSFAEKLIYEVFNQIGCDVRHDRATDWSCGKRYDFYLPLMNVIVEAHGIQHYVDSFNFNGCIKNGRNLSYENTNDVYKKELAINNGISRYIELDCRHSEFNYIKDSILKSELSVLFDLSQVDWAECKKAATTSNVVLCAELWNNGMKNTNDIARHTGLNICTVISNLKKATEINLCCYIPNYKKNKNRYKPVFCEELNKEYESISSVKKDGYTPSLISHCCNNIVETAYDMHWRFI